MGLSTIQCGICWFHNLNCGDGIIYWKQCLELPAKLKVPALRTTSLRSHKIMASTTAVMAMASSSPVTSSARLLVATDKEEKMKTPPEAFQDKISFVFNNLSPLNLQSKCEELREMLTEEYRPWMSQYLVVKRVSIEVNFHTLYANFLEVLSYADLNSLVLKETYKNIKLLLCSNKSIVDSSGRSVLVVLKNLGHWLGLLTLAKNKPIYYNDLELKSLLVEAYLKGQHELLYVLPFVSTVLESCAKSRVFKPPNPWTMGLMKVLAELYQVPHLKLRLKFEIERLCSNLNLDITSDVKPSNYFKDQGKHEVPELTGQLPSQLHSVVSIGTGSGNSSALSQEMPHITVSSSISPTSVDPANFTSGLPADHPGPGFDYMDIAVPGITNLSTHIKVNVQIPLFHTYPHLKRYVRPAVERAVQEWKHPIVDRSIKIALTTCEQIVKKDFALDPDESHMRAAAHHMARNLTASMAMILCRDQLLVSIASNLKSAFISSICSPSPQQKEMIEYATHCVARDNMELACAFIQKTAIEEAIPQIDKRLFNEFERRKQARNEGSGYYDHTVLTYQAEQMPERIRIKLGGISPTQMKGYEEFGRNIPGFLPMTERDAAMFIPKPVMAYCSDELTRIYEKLVNDLEHFLQSIMNSLAATSSGCHINNLHRLMECLLIAISSRDIASASFLIEKAVNNLLDGVTHIPGEQDFLIRYRDIHIRVLKAIQDHQAFSIHWTNKQVTRCLIECHSEFRYNADAVDCLIRAQLVNMPQYDLHLACSMESGLNYVCMAFAMQLVQTFLVDERNSMYLTANDFYHTVDELVHIAAHTRSPPEGILNLIEMLRANHGSGLVDRPMRGPSALIHSGILTVTSREFDDPSRLIEKTECLLRDWVRLYHTGSETQDTMGVCSLFVQQMYDYEILKNDELITQFLRLSTKMCVDACYRILADTCTSPPLSRAKCYYTLDAFVGLLVWFIRNSGDVPNFASKVLGIVAGVLLEDHESCAVDFQPLPYYRILIMLFLKLNAPEPILETGNFKIVTAFMHTFHIVRPAKAPSFAYAWMELFAHRVFIGRILAVTPQQKGWGMYAKLLIGLFQFMTPFLRSASSGKSIAVLYKGTLRVLLLLLHDFPEFLCDYHQGFCDVIPPNCIQMRNLILSAYPRNMKVPDPYSPTLKIGFLPEITCAPRVCGDLAANIQPLTFKKDLDLYLKTRTPVTFLSQLQSNLQTSSEPGMRYNIPLMNALVLYVGTEAIQCIHSLGFTPNLSTVAHCSHMDILENLAVDLDSEGRYLFLNAIVNQLRYPNSHTCYFICTVLHLFAVANSETIQEQITRVLLERVICNKPHPWGVSVTLRELIKNPMYKFWDHEFAHYMHEIEKAYERLVL